VWTAAFTHAFGRCAVTNDGGCIVSENDMDNPNSGASNHIHRRLHQMAGDSSMECPTKVRKPPPYSAEQVANRNAKVWHGATENGP
jgi:hypothetical protein